MSQIILTCNAGSTNSKFAAFDTISLERRGYATSHGMAETIEWLCSIGSLDIAAIGHRVVHGGREFTQPALITSDALKKFHDYSPLAPLHQPTALRLIEETQKLYPNIPQVACFDTAFHHSMPDIERRLPLPRWYHNEGFQRYGFHGLSYQHIAEVLPNYAGSKSYEKVIALHLGGGSSACAMKNLKSVGSTMGFSTLDGLMMGTRCGALDPGAVLHMLKELHMTVEEVDRLLYLESGLQGVSGISGDMRTLLTNNKTEAKEAIALYCHLASKQIAALLPILGGLNALVFTGGIGENAASVREQISAPLRWLGDFQTYIIPADEERVIANACRAHILASCVAAC